jgi:hypothetical protein
MKTRCLTWVALALLAGCADTMLEDVGPTVAPRPAPSSQPVRRSRSVRARPGAGEFAPGGDVYLLYLSPAGKSAGAILQSPYAQTITLANADPTRVTYLMAWLTEPSGQGGSGERMFLVYTDPTVQDWSARLAGMLDVPANEDTGWARAVTSLLAVAGPRFAEPSLADKILKQLEPLCVGRPDAEHRWPACMFAGRLLDEILGRPREAAGRFEQAASISLKTSPAWLIARYAQARSLRAAGDRAAARAIAADIVQHAGAGFSRTPAFREARKMAQAK